MIIWDTFMFRDEFSMLAMRLEEAGRHVALSGTPVWHVAVEARWTHRAVPKELELARFLGGDLDLHGPHREPDLAPGQHLTVLADGWDPDPHAPWVNEHHQRNTAWRYIDGQAGDDDWVLIGDVDEIPSAELLAAPPKSVGAVPMRTFLFAVDWEVAIQVPPACVAARVEWLRAQARTGCYLAEVRDGRASYPVFPGPGGWHFSWTGEGGPAWQREKLATATCHTEILGTQEAQLIRSGARWATTADGGGLPVRGVDVDGTWPAYIRERRCPPAWFRPRGNDETDRAMTRPDLHLPHPQFPQGRTP